ncbi:uncharacterized protein B0P05DRAFT_536959 [Gilbertella persicaria]|uniref:uncharacterized protein n=1 Tax=Gilbertella persicaria TaxID=101096 RepID=UPI00222078AE|nr:uncharacterized protein B0P05DRAFT_536959 [Gilbertella persicaria]KAI8083341.1 hypothetical protein B0P05DRAFT_536959 [Gilbertella persicaria]
MTKKETDENGEQVKKSRRPMDGAFRQQRLPAWQPVLTPRTVLPTLFIVGILFCPAGGLLWWNSNKVNPNVFCRASHRTLNRLIKS